MKNFFLKFCLLPLAMLFIGCPQPPKAIPVGPPQVDKVAPKVDQVHSTTKEVGVNQKSAEDKLIAQHAALMEQKQAITDTLLKVEDLAQKLPSDSPLKQDADKLINSLRDLETRNTLLEKRNGELVILNDEQKKLLEKLENEINDLKSNALLKDNEVTELRSQLQTYGNRLNDLQIQLSKSQVTAAKASVYRNWILGIVGSFVLWTVVKNVLMVYLPTTRFRL